MSTEEKKCVLEIKKTNYNQNLRARYENIHTNRMSDTDSKISGYPQNIPQSNIDKFFGRKRELKLLHQKLQHNGQVAVEGVGGVGKTELAIQYSLLHLKSNTYPGGICWIQARKPNIGSQIVDFAHNKLGLKPLKNLELLDQVYWLWKRWREGNKLIVLDDVKNYSIIERYLPPQEFQFKVLITTRLKLDCPSTLYLEGLSELDALNLLIQIVGSDKVNQELATAKELCRRLGYLPLALQLMGQYVKKRRISLSKELQHLEDKEIIHPLLRSKKNDLLGL